MGRLGYVGHKGIQVVVDMVYFFMQRKLNILVMDASIRHPLHCVAAAKAGDDIATVPLNVLLQMIQRSLTDT